MIKSEKCKVWWKKYNNVKFVKVSKGKKIYDIKRKDIEK